MSAVAEEKNNSEYIGFRCDPNISDRLKTVSTAEERSVAYLVRLFVAEGLRAYEERGGVLPKPGDKGPPEGGMTKTGRKR